MSDPRYIFCSVQEWQREQEQKYRLLAEIRKIHRTSFWQHIHGLLNKLFFKPRVSTKKCNTSTPLEAEVVSEEKLTKDGFNSEEILALSSLREWYHISGREDIVILRHWEFLKLLVNNGRLEV